MSDIAATLVEMGLTVESVFVPFSQSRNKAEERKTLNWIITVKRNGREILKTDYSAGIAHCPSYGAKVPAAWKRPACSFQSMACDFECESGYKVAKALPWEKDKDFSADKKQPILPDSIGVLYSLTMDSDVLNHGGFEDWAEDLGYETDSRNAEKIYRACLEIALKIRGAIGESGLEKLRETFQDY